MSHKLSAAFFQSLVDFDASNARVQAHLACLRTDTELLQFFIHYASWNRQFANGVSALTSLIGNTHDLFVEAGLPRAIADRSNLIASYIFDAARDEYNDHINPARDSHRCLAQAMLLGMSEVLGLDKSILDEPEPAWLAAINATVVPAYTGKPMAILDSPFACIFFGMGYHLGSELLADREFSMIDEHLRAHHSELVGQLLRKTVFIANTDHRCYAWIGIHSGHDGGVEADHFDDAIEGVQQSFSYIPAGQEPAAIEYLSEGFRAFAAHHAGFFARKG